MTSFLRDAWFNQRFLGNGFEYHIQQSSWIGLWFFNVFSIYPLVIKFLRVSICESTSCLLSIFHRFVKETVPKGLILLATNGLMQEMLLPGFSENKQWKLLPLAQITLVPWRVAKIQLTLSPNINSFGCPCVFMLTILKHLINALHK